MGGETFSQVSPGYVVPLGIFGVIAGQREFEQIREDLRALAGAIPKSERAPISNYLRKGSSVIALMEYTRDVINGAFGVSGGSAIHTDGVYYWRLDAAEYVEHYGIGLPADFLERGRRLAWLAPSLTETDILAIDDYLVGHIRRIATAGDAS